MNNLFIKFSLLLCVYCVPLLEVKGQTVLIWEETFDYAKSTITKTKDGVTWNCYVDDGFSKSVNKDNCSVNINKFLRFRKNSGGEYVWETSSIDISSFATVYITIDLLSSKNVEGDEDIKFYYSLDGGVSYLPFDINSTHSGVVTSTIVASLSLSSETDVQLMVKGGDFDNNDVYRLDNVKVVGKVVSEVLMQNGVDLNVNDAIRFYDSGGKNDDYFRDQDYSMSFKAPVGYDLVVDFDFFEIEDDCKPIYGYECDYLTVNNGNREDILMGTGSNRTIVSGTRVLDFSFVSDPGLERAGWSAIIYKKEKLADVIFSDTDVSEGAGHASVRLALSKVMSKDVRFEWCTADDQALKSFDYTPVSWTEVTIPAGELYVDIKITINDDDSYEGDEKFTVFIKNSVNAKIGQDRISCTILDNELTPPNLSVADIRVDEDAGLVKFTAIIDNISDKDLRFQWSTANGTALASTYWGNGTVRKENDYVGMGWTEVTIKEGQLSVNLTVTLNDDYDFEGDENFVVYYKNLTGENNVVIPNQNYAHCNIIDDESNASIAVDKNRYTPSELIEDVLVTGCVSVNQPSIKFLSGANDAVGYFEAGDSNFPLASGIIISTGKAEEAVGSSSNASSGNPTGVLSASDEDVRVLTNGKAVNAQVLEFKFTPSGDEIEFNYIFASEEYGEGWECDNRYTDVFGFILIGKDGEEVLETAKVVKKNIAIVPETTDEKVSIYNVNNTGSCGSNKYFETHYTGFSTAFNGRTKVLKARAKVHSCEEYTIRLIVSDKGDSQYDSAVFIETGSFKSNEVKVENSVKDFEGDYEQMYEGCGNSYLMFSRDENVDVPISFNLTIEGEAGNGIDFIYVDEAGDKIGDGKIPTTVNMIAGQTELKYHYQTVKDLEDESDETFTVSFYKGCSCSNPVLYEKTIRIIDTPDIRPSTTTAVTCDGKNPVAAISINLRKGLYSTDYLYNIDGGLFINENVLTLNGAVEGSKHTVIVKDLFGCVEETVEVTIPVYTQIAANAGDPITVCENYKSQLKGTGGMTYQWSCDDSSALSFLSSTTESQPEVSNITKGVYKFTLTVKDFSGTQCVSTDDVILTVLENAHFAVVTDKLKYCSGNEIKLSANVDNNKSDDAYFWSPSEGMDDIYSRKPIAKFEVDALESKGFSLIITKKETGCSWKESTVLVPLHPNPKVELKAESILCAEGANGEAVLQVDGVSPFTGGIGYMLQIFKGAVELGTTADDLLNLDKGNYNIIVTNAESCQGTVDFSIHPKPQPKGIFFN